MTECTVLADGQAKPVVSRWAFASGARGSGQTEVGGGMGKVEDVVNAATRFVADSRILGRTLCIGPKVHAKQTKDEK